MPTPEPPQTIDLDKDQGDNVQKKRKRKVGEASTKNVSNDFPFPFLLNIVTPNY